MSDAVIDETLVRHIADLSRLTLTDAEVAAMTRELSEILGYVRQLNEPSTDHVPPTEHALAISNVFREDEIRGSLGEEASLMNAPQRQDAFFKVPKVLDGEGGA